MTSRFVSRLEQCDAFAAVKVENPAARWANRALIVCLILFSLSVPHSIAAAQISFGLGLIAWIVRDAASRKFHFARTSIDLPLLCFASLTFFSSIFSVEPSVSLPKLKALILFGLIYLIATNLTQRGVQAAAGVMIVSSLVGVGFSLMEKVWGRGMVVTAIESGSPLAESKLHYGDVIWMVDRRRVFSLAEANGVLRVQPVGKVVDIEALHAGDPIPVTIEITEELKTQANPLGVQVGGRSRRFRVSGFSRQFLTYAEQMQILAMLGYGGLLVSLKRRKSAGLRAWPKLFALLFGLFSLGLVLTASRAALGACLVAVFFVSLGLGGRLTKAIALASILVLGSLGFFVLNSARRQATVSFDDDSTTRRIAYMQAGLRMIPRHPLLGVGMDSHKRHWFEWGFPGSYITHTHSTPIQIAMERGLPALGCYMWLMAALITMAWRGYRNAEEKADLFRESLALGAFGAIIGFSVSSLTNYNFGDSEALMMLLFVVGLVAVGRPQSNKQL